MKIALLVLAVALVGAGIFLFRARTSGEGPRVGDLAPDVTLPLDDGRKLKLRGIDRPVVVYFYPKDDTPGCTKEACTYRDRSGEITKAGALVVGVSFDDAESHKKFREKHALKFELATDDGSIAEAFGVGVRGVSPLRFHARDTFVIGKDGRVRAVLRGADPVASVDEVLAALQG